VEVSFECTKPDVTDHSLTTVVATTRNLGGTPMTGYVLQCAVPKTMSLAMRTASGGELPVGGVVTQRLDVTNSQHGEKALAMRLRLAWNAGGAAVVEQATVNFPAGL
jgi:AP-1 complex subunit gamma-1